MNECSSFFSSLLAGLLFSQEQTLMMKVMMMEVMMRMISGLLLSSIWVFLSSFC